MADEVTRQKRGEYWLGVITVALQEQCRRCQGPETRVARCKGLDGKIGRNAGTRPNREGVVLVPLYATRV